jgi:predicted HicB family RNase H-like nuclease
MYLDNGIDTRLKRSDGDIITFPLKILYGYRNTIKEAAQKNHQSMNQFILEAIKEKIQKVG